MATTPQADLFASAARVDAAADLPCPDRVRGKLNVILSAMRTAERWPFPPARRRVFDYTVPQMCNWLPDDEAAAIRAEYRERAAGFDAAEAK